MAREDDFKTEEFKTVELNLPGPDLFEPLSLEDILTQSPEQVSVSLKEKDPVPPGREAPASHQPSLFTALAAWALVFALSGLVLAVLACLDVHLSPLLVGLFGGYCLLSLVWSLALLLARTLLVQPAAGRRLAWAIWLLLGVWLGCFGACLIFTFL